MCAAQVHDERGGVRGFCCVALQFAGVAQGVACAWDADQLLKEMQPYNVRRTTADSVLASALSAMAISAAACANEPLGGLAIGTVSGTALVVKRALLSHPAQSWEALTVDVATASAWLGATGALLVFVSLVAARRTRLPWRLSAKLLEPRPLDRCAAPPLRKATCKLEVHHEERGLLQEPQACLPLRHGLRARGFEPVGLRRYSAEVAEHVTGVEGPETRYGLEPWVRRSASADPAQRFRDAL